MNVADAFVRLLIDGKTLRRQVESEASKAGDSAGKRLGTSMSGAAGKALKIGMVGVLAAAVALGGGMAYAANKAAAFETAMLNVNSIAKQSDADFGVMKSAVLDLSRILPQSADTLAKGLYDIASSGFAGKDGLVVLEAAAKAASAGLSTTEDSARGVTAVLNAYKRPAKDAARVSDVMFKIVDRGVVTFSELANEIGTVTAVASKVGVSLEEVGAGMAVLTKNGISAAESATALRGLMNSMLKPSKEAADLSEKLGIEWNLSGLKGKGLTGVLNDMIEATGGDADMMAILTGDVRATTAALVLAGDEGKAFNAELALMEDAGGATDTALSYQKQGLAFQLGILKNNIDAAAISIGTALIPAITPLIVGLTGWFQENEKLIGSIAVGLVEGLKEFLKVAGPIFEWIVKNVIPVVVDFAKAFFGAAYEIGTRVVGAISDLVKKISGNRGQMALLGGIAQGIRDAFGALFDMIGSVINEITRIVDHIRAKKKTMDDLRAIAQAIADAFKAVTDQMFGSKEETGRLAAKMKIVNPEMVTMRDSAKDIAEAFGQVVSMIRGAIDEIKKIDKAIDDAANAIARFQEQVGAWGQTSIPNWPNLVPEPLDPHGYRRQHGGPVAQGQTYWVGEQGPELFTPTQSGTIVPNSKIGGGLSHIDLTVHLPDGSTRRERLLGGSQVDVWLRGLEAEAVRG